MSSHTSKEIRFSEMFADIQWDRAPISGLRMAARDFVEWCQDLREDAVEQLDSELEAAGGPTLTVMRRRGYRQLLTVLGRGRIRTDREWHLVRVCSLDTADQTLSPIQRDRANQLLRDYEARRGRKSTEAQIDVGPRFTGQRDW